METTFKIGQVVRATTNSQKLTAGSEYEVTDLIKDSTPWGTFVTYILVGPGAEDGLLQVRNGHLLLEEI